MKSTSEPLPPGTLLKKETSLGLLDSSGCVWFIGPTGNMAYMKKTDEWKEVIL